MNKRGATHADWAISMGIFVIYVLSMFIFIQPGAQTVFREENLISIVENGVINASEFVVEVTPFYINFSSSETLKEKFEKFEGKFDINVEESPLNGVDEDFRLFDEVGNEVPMAITKESALYFTYTFKDIDPDIIHTFYFYYLDGGYKDKKYFYEDDKNPDNDVTETYFTHSFGSTEELKGLKLKDVENLCSGIDYGSLKENWGYPTNKDFRIYYVAAASPVEAVPPTYDYTERTPVCEEVEPYEQASVFVKELVTSYMNRTGGRRQVRINLRVW